MLGVKGYAIECEPMRGKRIVAPRNYGMLHDPDGEKWPKCSLLICGFERSVRRATEEEVTAEWRDYYGEDYQFDVGKVKLPPRDLSKWTQIDEIKTAWYTRPGYVAPGRYFHKMNQPRGTVWLIFLVKGKAPAILYRHGRALRLELPAGCIADSRGIVYP